MTVLAINFIQLSIILFSGDVLPIGITICYYLPKYKAKKLSVVEWFKWLNITEFFFISQKVSIISLEKLDSIIMLLIKILTSLTSFQCYLKCFGIVLVFRLFKDFICLLFIKDNSTCASF